MNNTERLRAKDRSFMEKVVFVSFLIGIALFAAGCLWPHFAGIWFDTEMQNPAMHQYTLAFSLILQLPAWVFSALGSGAMIASLTTVAMVLLHKFMGWVDTRIKAQFWYQSVENKLQKTENSENGERHL